MDKTWIKQDPDKAEYPELIWSKPENRHSAGRLLIISGSAAEASKAYSSALKTGVGVVDLLLPMSLSKVIPVGLEAHFAPVTATGSFARIALSEALDLSTTCDGVLLGGDFGHNSETAVFLKSFSEKYHGQLVFTGDSADYFFTSESIFTRPDTLFVLPLKKLQKFKFINSISPLKSTMSLHHYIEALHEICGTTKLSIVSHFSDSFVVSSGQNVSTTMGVSLPVSESGFAAALSVWWLQNPGNTFEAVTTGVFEYLKNRS